MKLSAYYLKKDWKTHWIVPLFASVVCFVPTAAFAVFPSEDEIFTQYTPPKLQPLPYSKVTLNPAPSQLEPDVDPKVAHALRDNPIQVTTGITAEGSVTTWNGVVVSANPNFTDKESQQLGCHAVARDLAASSGQNAAVTSSTGGSDELVDCTIKVRVAP